LSVGLEQVFLGKGIPAMNLSWVCQFNAVPLFGSLEERSVRTMDAVSFWSAAASCVLYLVFGAAVYLCFGSAIEDDVMKNIHQDTGVGMVLPSWCAFTTEVVIGAAILGTLPFFLIECRNMGHRTMLGGEVRKTYIRWCETAVLLVVCYIIAVSVENLAIVLALVGVIPANIIAWLLPSIAFLSWNRGAASKSMSCDEPDPPKGSVGSVCFAWLSIIVFSTMLPLGIISMFCRRAGGH